MLADFVTQYRDTIVSRAHARVSSRAFRGADVTLADGIPVFLEQLSDALRIARSSELVDHEQIRQSAGRHGRDLLRLGLTIAQVVQCYGDVCQVVTELAVEHARSFSSDEFKTLNLCTDDAIANAVTEYSHEREIMIVEQGTEKLGVLAHELRNLLNTALLSYEMVDSGQVALKGSTGLLLGRSLMGLRDLIDRSLAEVRLDAGIGRLERISVSGLLEEVEIAAAIQAKARGVSFGVATVDRSVSVDGDRQILAAALSNLIHNACKFTHKMGRVMLNTRVTADRVFFEIEDECGGLPPGDPDDLFRPFEQQGTDRSGIGLGLSICMKAAKANAGNLRVRDIPGKGCVFILELPRQPLLPTVDADGANVAHGLSLATMDSENA